MEERYSKHKDRSKDSVTIAGPVVINDVRGNMAAVVRQTSGNHYDIHRILMPDGSAFEFIKKTQMPNRTGPHSKVRMPNKEHLYLKQKYSKKAKKSTRKLRKILTALERNLSLQTCMDEASI